MKETKSNGESDLDFIKRICEGDISGFRNLVEKYKDVSFSLACSILKDEREAEDVLQDAFMKVLKNIDKFRFDSSFSTWLYRIVVNTSLNAITKNKRHLYDELSAVDRKESTELSSIEILQSKERNDYIITAFKLMKPDEALLMRLHYLCELSISEIKAVTNFSESNVKVILFRARKNMQEILNKLTGNDINNLI